MVFQDSTACCWLLVCHHDIPNECYSCLRTCDTHVPGLYIHVGPVLSLGCGTLRSPLNRRWTTTREIGEASSRTQGRGRPVEPNRKWLVPPNLVRSLSARCAHVNGARPEPAPRGQHHFSHLGSRQVARSGSFDASSKGRPSERHGWDAPNIDAFSTPFRSNSR